MIKATELRIGNLVSDALGQIHSATAGTIMYLRDAEESDYNNCNPIPLTEEILLKCGFRKTHATFVYAEDMAIGLDLDWVGIFCERMQEDIELDCPKSIHQLQNLYFVLTGQELNTEGLI